MTTMSVVGECFFWYRLTRVVPDKFHRAVKWLCVCVSALWQCLLGGRKNICLGGERPRRRTGWLRFTL